MATGGLPSVDGTGFSSARDDSPDQNTQQMGNDGKESRWRTKMRETGAAGQQWRLVAARVGSGRCNEQQVRAGGGR